MAEVVLVRHGQANSAARTEDEYDRLSDLGRQQGRWLGEWLREVRSEFDHIVAGSLTRHLHTAEEMGVAPEIDARWNELRYHDLVASYEAASGVTAPEAGPDFPDYFAGLLAAWEADRLAGAPERFDAFRGRVLAALDDVREEGERILVVTSGGVIGQAIGRTMGLDLNGTARLVAGIGNTSLQRLVWTGRGWGVAEFGATPHLAHAARAHARTFY
ncbi:MAG: histidine phosphatase family protein [Pseudomonadota bacterium]